MLYCRSLSLRANSIFRYLFVIKRQLFIQLIGQNYRQGLRLYDCMRKKLYNIEKVLIGCQNLNNKMKVKEKIIKSKQNDKAKDRYNAQIHNDCTPNMLKSKEYAQNKENHFYNINQNNYPSYKQNNVQTLKSMELPKRFKTLTSDENRFFTRRDQKQSQERNDLRSSQQLFNFRYHSGMEGHIFREDLTFGLVNNNRRHLITSREFLQQKKLKTQVIDQIIQNNKRALCKSFNQFSIIAGNCANHNNKKAKYRLICQLSQGEQEMFYCSKCAINLLQKGFKIQQIKVEGFDNQNSLVRIKNISKCELRLKSLQQRSRSLFIQDVYRHDMLMIEQQIQSVSSKYQSIFCALEQMRKSDLVNLSQLYQRKESERRISFDNLRNVQQQIQSIESEIKQLISNNSFLTMNQNEFNFFIINLNNKANRFQQHLSSHYISNHNRHRISFEIVTSNHILQKLQQKIISHDDNHVKKSLNSRELKARLQGETQSIQESMATDELKQHPFRTLFPNDQSQYMGDYKSTDRRGGNSIMLNSVRQCPSFGSYS